jgi:hypothetical protein
MKEEDLNQKDSFQKSPSSSEDLPKEVGKKHGSLLNKLIFVICVSIISFVGLNFVACNFMIPGTTNHANLLGGLKNPPPTDCKESERRGFETLITLMTTIIALKTRIEDTN